MAQNEGKIIGISVNAPVLETKIISWNVNGIRAALKNGLIDFVTREDADILAFQEIKNHDFQMPMELSEMGYTAFANPAEKKGYSGTLILTKKKPLSHFTGLGEFGDDTEGRVLGVEYEGFWFVNIYFPNSQRELTRLDYKIEFNNRVLKLLEKLRETKPVVVCGDMNVAHTEIDIARPKDNEHNAGFTKEERQWFSEFLEHGYVDTLRMFNKEPGQYTWWSYRFNARSRNIGWRIDYFVVSSEIKNNVVSSDILQEVTGSDHAPIRLVIES